MTLLEPVRADSPSNGTPQPLGEVIEASTTGFAAQACVLNEAPAFGSFVRVAVEPDVVAYGVVGFVETAGIDPSARPVMRGFGGVRDRQIYAENPDLTHVLRTVFQAVTVGFEVGGHIFQFLPPRPPHLHYSVHAATPEQVRRFTDAGLDYLATLAGAAELPCDELVAASVREVAKVRGEVAEFPRQAGRELAQLLRGDYARLNAILRRVAPVPGR